MNRSLRLTIAGLAAGALVAGASIAGAVLAPPTTPVTVPPLPIDAAGDDRATPVAPSNATAAAGTIELAGDAILGAAAQDVTAPTAELDGGQFLVGAARASLAPAPSTFGEPGTTWQTEDCTSWGVDGEQSVNQDHVMPTGADDIRGWPAASPDCIYLGGFGLGPVRPATAVGPGGVWVRSIAISNGGELFTYSIADTVGWFARYDSEECADCGILDVREALADNLKVDVGNVIVSSTHTHAGADTYGGWGGIPDWYRRQLREATIASVKQAVANMQLATIEVGEAPLREYNNQRRANYESTADTGATWLQASEVPTCADRGRGEPCNAPAPVIATWSTFAGHPTIVNDPILHADWPGAAARRFESTFGGVGLMFEGGLGNVSVSGRGAGGDAERAEATGRAIADAIAGDMARNAKPLATNTMKAAVTPFEHPSMTNPGLTTLATVGLFDREFTPNSKGAGLPGVWTSRAPSADDPASAAGYRPSTGDCTSAGPTVRTVAGAHRIGEFVVAFGPGELFSNLTEVVKEEVDWTAATMVLGQTNDALGYIIQSFEFDASANVLTHYGPDLMPAGPRGAEYEEVFSIDRCLGDHVLEVLLASTSTIR